MFTTTFYIFDKFYLVLTEHSIVDKHNESQTTSFVTQLFDYRSMKF